VGADRAAHTEDTAARPGRPWLERPLCEPVELRPGARARVERVQHGEGAGPSLSFPHFHDVHELVLFGQVGGHMFANGRRFRLAPGSVAFVPSTQTHDFALAPGPRDWVLVQIDAGQGPDLATRPGLSALAHAFCATPGPALRAQLDALSAWALPLEADAPQLPAIVELMLHAAVAAPCIAGERLPQAEGIERLRPAIEALRRDPAHPPSAQQAAALCAMSPAWFSRRFQRQIGQSWSDYVRTHRLHLASQRLLEQGGSVAAIADALGFSSPSHFGDLFLRRFGVTPGAYRRRRQSG